MGSVLAKVSIPFQHSGAALLKLGQMGTRQPTRCSCASCSTRNTAWPSGAAVWVTTALSVCSSRVSSACSVIDETVNHFMRFMGGAPSVLWHQCLLSLYSGVSASCVCLSSSSSVCSYRVARYKNDLTEEQNDALRTLTHAQRHPLITPDIQRELHHATFRGQQMLPENMITGAYVLSIYSRVCL